MKVKPYSDMGCYTSVHHSLIDNLLRTLNGNTFKILLFILRQTTGWNRQEAEIGYRDIIKGTGIKHPMTIQRGLRELISAKHIIPSRSDDKWDATAYRLNQEFEIDWTPIRVGDSQSASKSEVESLRPDSKNEAGIVSVVDVGSVSRNEANIMNKGKEKRKQSDMATSGQPSTSKNGSDTSESPANSNADSNGSNNGQDNIEKKPGWEIVFAAVMEGCGITANQLRADGKLRGQTSEATKYFLLELDPRTPSKIAHVVAAEALWWRNKENSETGQKFGLPTPPILVRHLNNFIQWCRDNLEGYLPTDRTFEVVGLRA
ncbi:MAG: replication protein [Blastocatellia bacterium]